MNEINFTIRGCPRSIRDAIAESAKNNRRSANAETISKLIREGRP